MEVRKHTSQGVWVWGEYDFYINNRLVAKFRRQLIGLDYAYVYFLPEAFRGDYCIRIDLRYITSEEALTKAINIVRKKLYLIAENALSDIRKVDIEE